MRRILREPLLHFVVIGAALFALPSPPGKRPTTPQLDRDPIVVDGHVRASLARGWRKTHSAPPTDSELERLTKRWIDREILYREGLARGLDRDDERIRALVAEKMSFVLSAQALIVDPSEAELRQFFETHIQDFVEAERIDFVHVFVKGHDDDARHRAAELLALLEGGASPSGLGDTFSGGRRYRRRRLQDLTRTFGESFTRGLKGQAPGEWAMRRSRFGFHLVRIEARTPGGRPDFDSVRGRVEEAWRADRRSEAVAAQMATLRSRWEVVRKP